MIYLSKDGRIIAVDGKPVSVPSEEFDALMAAKQDTIIDLGTIRSGAAAGATALQTVPDTYRTAEEQDAIHDSTKQDTISDLSTIRSGAAAGATALQSVPSTYRTAAAQDAIHDSTKQDVLSTSDKQAIADLHKDAVTSVDGKTGAVITSGNNISGKWVFIGDSYSTGLLTTGSEGTGWPEIVVKDLGLSSSNVVYSRVGGIGFTTSSTSFLTKLKEVASNTSVTNSEVKHIVVCGGFNDREQLASTIETKISEFCSYAKSNFVNAKISIGMIAGSLDTTIREYIYSNSLAGYKSCVKYGATYLTNVEYILHNYSYCASDYTHCIQEGYNAIGHGISQALQGSFSVSYPLTSMTYSSLSGGITGITGLPNLFMENNMVGVVESHIAVTTASFTFSSNSCILLCYLNPSLIEGSIYDMACGWDAVCYVKTGSEFVTIPVFVYVLNRYLCIKHVETTGSGFNNLENVTSLDIFFTNKTLLPRYS